MPLNPLALFVFAALATSPASAQQAIDISGGASVVSDYRFRGISRSDGDPAVQASLHGEHASGLNAGLWASTLGGDSPYGDAEINFYAGWGREIGSGTRLSGGLIYYLFQGERDDALVEDHPEAWLRVSHLLGPVEAGVGIAYAIDAAGGDDNLHLHTDLSSAIPGTPLTIKGRVGWSDGALAPGGSYWDWSLGAEAALGRATLGLRYVDTDVEGGGHVDAGLVASLGVSF